MKARAFTFLFASLFLAALPNCSASEDATPADEADLTKEPSLTFGTWKSPECETIDDKTFQLRTYRIAANGIFANWERYSSPTCAASSQLFTIRMGGSSKTDRMSKVVSRAFDIRVFIDERAIVPTSQEGIDRLARECPGPAWKTGAEVDVTKTGCGAIVPRNAECPVEYDILRLSGTKLYFGDRARPLCTEATRPTKFNVYGVKFDHAL
jgi:hypothetical protein